MEARARQGVAAAAVALARQEVPAVAAGMDGPRLFQSPTDQTPRSSITGDDFMPETRMAEQTARDSIEALTATRAHIADCVEYRKATKAGIEKLHECLKEHVEKQNAEAAEARKYLLAIMLSLLTLVGGAGVQVIMRYLPSGTQ
jgi:hypothetical protein